MKIIFFGSPSSAIPSFQRILESGHKIELVITQPDRPSGRGKKFTSSPVKEYARERNIPIYQPQKIRKDPVVLEKLETIKPDLNVVVAYGQIIPSSIIYYPPYDSINVHFSILPKYRGASPVQWAILNGEEKTGITIFELNEKMDEGNILAQKEVNILPGERSDELEFRLSSIGAELLIDTISRIKQIRHTKQDHSQASYAPLIKKEDGRIDWERDAHFIGRQVQAFTPWPSVFTKFKDKRIKIIKGKGNPPGSITAPPGEIVGLKKEGIQVCCGKDSIFLIEILQPENKKSMSAYAFSLGTRVNVGDKFK